MLLASMILLVVYFRLAESGRHVSELCNESRRTGIGPWGGRLVILVYLTPRHGKLTTRSKNIVNALPSGEKIVGFNECSYYEETLTGKALTIYSPASQLALVMRYSFSMLLTHIDSEYVALPRIEKKNSAGARPSHRVLKFLTIEKVDGA